MELTVGNIWGPNLFWTLFGPYLVPIGPYLVPLGLYLVSIETYFALFGLDNQNKSVTQKVPTEDTESNMICSFNMFNLDVQHVYGNCRYGHLFVLFIKMSKFHMFPRNCTFYFWKYLLNKHVFQNGSPGQITMLDRSGSDFCVEPRYERPNISHMSQIPIWKLPK